MTCEDVLLRTLKNSLASQNLEQILRVTAIQPHPTHTCWPSAAALRVETAPLCRQEGNFSALAHALEIRLTN